MDILFITQHYDPDLGPSAPLFTLLCRSLAARGHRVTVLTTVPHYPSGRVQAGFRGFRIRRSVEHGVRVIRAPLPSLNRSDLKKRFLQFLVFQLMTAWAGLSLRYDVSVVTGPGFNIWFPFFLLIRLRRKASIYSVHDVYPDVGISLGVFRNHTVIRLVAALEKYCLRHASAIRILSTSFKRALRRLGQSDEKMALIYDWVETDFIVPLPRDNSFACEHGLVDKFVVLYAGNLGLSQGLENILTVAQQLSVYADIHFVFVGEGAGRVRLERAAQEMGLTNVQFIPFQARERLPEVLASTDVSLVILRRGIGLESLPSKTYSIMASARPIIASVDALSETHHLVTKAQAGLCVPPEDPKKIGEAVLKLKSDRGLGEALGKNGRAWALQNHSVESAAIRFETLLSQYLLAGREGMVDLKPSPLWT